ncbi:Ctr copper transporter family protein [Nitzschia inconspicua]|uniref:Copper transport protein n=1 Tax=Nitzschia inconspicua TaxID=303405 RepID=A0A9K3PEC5_9STRA|nr:Ctr copper transporter family protein [Nitzschia inconspicua]
MDNDHSYNGDNDEDSTTVASVAATMSTTFCNGMSMVMSMSGFQSSLFLSSSSSSHNNNNNNNKNNNTNTADCLTYLFRNWRLDTSGKFQGAMVYTFLLAVLCEGMSYLQGKVRVAPNLQTRPKGHKWVMTLLYGIQQCLGWALMLISMMFSVELFLCVIVGVITGKLMFPTDQLQQQYSIRQRRTDIGTTGGGGGGGGNATTTTNTTLVDGQLRRQRSIEGVSEGPLTPTIPTRQDGAVVSGSASSTSTTNFRRRRR